jgi:hypothetical protein
VTWHAITTCNAEQWESYGRAMVVTFCRHWPDEVGLTVYAEGFSGDCNDHVQFVDLDQAAPWLAPWKATRTKEQRGFVPRPGKPHNFKYDAARFSHKIAAIGAAANEINGLECAAANLIWLDADIVTHADVTVDWLDSLWSSDADMAWLDRARCYPECGFMMFRLPACERVIRQIVATYQSGEIFKLQEWHDSYVIQAVCGVARQTQGLRIASLSGKARNIHHILPNSPLGERLDHLKGARKARGRTSAGERVIGSRTGYWV